VYETAVLVRIAECVEEARDAVQAELCGVDLVT
jgi:hypothetical protein